MFAPAGVTFYRRFLHPRGSNFIGDLCRMGVKVSRRFLPGICKQEGQPFRRFLLLRGLFLKATFCQRSLDLTGTFWVHMVKIRYATFHSKAPNSTPLTAKPANLEGTPLILDSEVHSRLKLEIDNSLKICAYFPR